MRLFFMPHGYSKDFASFEGNIWLNAASEGPLPLCAAAALNEAVGWKSRPYELDIPKFIAIQKELKDSIGRLIGVPARDVILANSASYGLHLLADGLPWQAGDEIIVMQNDFPTDILPWLALEREGVVVNQIKPRGLVLEPDELAGVITEKTKLFCISHVHTFTGDTVDATGLAGVCRDQGVRFVLNVSQSAGTMPIDLSHIPVDAVVCAGYKWLCGPYGVGFAWIEPEWRDQLDINRAYWPTVLSEEDLKSEGPLSLHDLNSARKYDVFGTANFFNFIPFKASIDYFLGIGLETVRAYHQELIDRLIGGIDEAFFEVISPREGDRRSSLVVISLRKKEKNETLYKALKDDGIYTAFWKGNLRMAPHVYNTQENIDRFIELLNTTGAEL